MQRPARNVDRMAALEVVISGTPVPDDPPSSAWSHVAAPADEDAGFADEMIFALDDDSPLEWGAARLGIP
jgi:hypothetical protein